MGPFFLFLLELEARILDPRMIDRVENGEEGRRGRPQVPQREVAVVELSVLEIAV
jgi:hypothetical protein